MTDELGAVLLIDAGPAGRSDIEGWLRDAGYQVITCADVSEAVRLAASRPFDAVMLADDLRDGHGIGVREQIKALSRQRATPVIHVGPHPRPASANEAADVYLAEPLERADLLATLRALVHQRRTHRALERLAARLGELAQVSVALGAVTTTDELVSSAAAWTAGVFGCPAVVCVQDLDGRRVAAGTEGRDVTPRVLPWSRVPTELAIGSRYLDEDPALWPMVRWPPGDTVRVVVARPRRDRPPVFVAMPTSLADEGSPVLTQLGNAVASGIEAVRAYDEERTLSLTIQRSLLPRQLPDVPGVDVAFRYAAANTQAEIGGDFYEVSPVDGRLVVAVGDVAGHSLHAATVMAELRHALRAYLAEGHRLGRILELLNTLVLRMLPDEMATVCIVSLDPGTGELRVANAGHPPPAICVDGTVRYVEERCALLGLRTPHNQEVGARLPVGGTLVLYTDGLIERRGESLQAGLARLTRVASTVDKDLETFCDRLLTEVHPAVADDIAVVAVRRR